jgi:ATP-dependent 26S proteasome regulatory subunit
MIHDLKTLVLSFHPAVAFDTPEEDRVELLADRVAEELGMPVFTWTVTKGLVQKPTAHSNLNTAEPIGVLQHLASLTVEGIFLLKDFARFLDDPSVCRAFRDAASNLSRSSSSMWITGAGHDFPADADSEIVHFEMALPGKKELGEVVATVVRSLRERIGATVELSKPELDKLLEALSGMTANQVRQIVASVILDDGRLGPQDIPKVLDKKAEVLGQDGLLEYFPAEDNAYELGGFDRLKTWLDRSKLGFTDEAKELGLKAPGGIMLVGVQGCGKSLAAKFIARDWEMPLLKLDAGRLYNKYHGESEKNLRRAIALAESMAPTVLWIDEIEKSFASFGSGQNDGGASQRIFATLLTWLQEKKESVFVVATANDIFKLPPELMRKGRLDEIFFVDLPDGQERGTIFHIHLERRKQDAASFDMATLVGASEGMSGAEIEQAVIASLYGALHERRPLDTEMILTELRSTVPLSVSRAEDIERLRELARERFVPVR